MSKDCCGHSPESTTEPAMLQTFSRDWCGNFPETAPEIAPDKQFAFLRTLRLCRTFLAPWSVWTPINAPDVLFTNLISLLCRPFEDSFSNIWKFIVEKSQVYALDVLLTNLMLFCRPSENSFESSQWTFKCLVKNICSKCALNTQTWFRFCIWPTTVYV